MNISDPRYADGIDAAGIYIYLLHEAWFYNFQGVMLTKSSIANINASTTHQLSFVAQINKQTTPHFVAVYVHDNIVHYYDPLGKILGSKSRRFLITKLNQIELKYYIFQMDSRKDQGYSGNCGWFCLRYLHLIHHNNNIPPCNEKNIEKYKKKLCIDRPIATMIYTIWKLTKDSPMFCEMYEGIIRIYQVLYHEVRPHY